MKKRGLLNLVIFWALLLSCPSLAEEKANDPGHPVQLASESLNYQRYGPAGCGSEAEGHDSWVLDSNNYQYGPLRYGTESEGH